MEQMRKEGKQHHNADVTFRIVPTTGFLGGSLVVRYQSQFVVNSDLFKPTFIRKWNTFVI